MAISNARVGAVFAGDLLSGRTRTFVGREREERGGRQPHRVKVKGLTSLVWITGTVGPTANPPPPSDPFREGRRTRPRDPEKITLEMT